ncbi:MAG TPA: DUF6314 family protein [Dongiaceae bacterium]|nr:DUF6314 family protein [Dongiaceae bacterium]
MTKPAIATQHLSDPGAVRHYFAGTWSLTRRIIDRRAGLTGHFDGEAILRPDLQGFDYDETGSMRFGSYEGRASQSYRWDIDAVGTLVVRFRDGRLFHALDLSGGDMAVAHLCAADLYRGRFRLVDDVCWLSRWQVSGPRKDQLILNRYRRMPSPM